MHHSISKSQKGRTVMAFCDALEVSVPCVLVVGVSCVLVVGVTYKHGHAASLSKAST